MRTAALFLDFDNVFSGLCALDEGAAYDFATDPARWMRWLMEGRRPLIRRCYMNPGGSYTPRAGGWLEEWHERKLYFSGFRAAFVQAGFQVVDCPPLARGKNGADIQMVLDVVDALSAPVPIGEFLLLSSDSDFTPLLHRLRLHDRRTTLLVQQSVAPALVAAADRVLGLEDFITQALPPLPPEQGMSQEGQERALLELVRRLLAQSEAPLQLAHLGHQLHAAGPWVKASRYAGHGSLHGLLAATNPEEIVLTPGPGGGWLHDRQRHAPPHAHAEVMAGAEPPQEEGDPA